MMWKIAIVVLASMIVLSVTQRALACKGTQVLYEDNFTTMDPAWGTPSPNLSINNGKLIIQPKVNKTYNVINQANLFEDMDACIMVTLTKSEDLSGSAGGIIFWAKDYSDYYVFQVKGDGRFSVWHWVNNRWLNPVTWRDNTAIKKGLAQPNQLRVVTKGNQATVYINDMEAVTVKGQLPQGGSFVGMHAESPLNSQAVWEFSDLKITKP